MLRTAIANRLGIATSDLDIDFSILFHPSLLMAIEKKYEKLNKESAQNDKKSSAPGKSLYVALHTFLQHYEGFPKNADEMTVETIFSWIGEVYYKWHEENPDVTFESDDPIGEETCEYFLKYNLVDNISATTKWSEIKVKYIALYILNPLVRPLPKDTVNTSRTRFSEISKLYGCKFKPLNARGEEFGRNVCFHVESLRKNIDNWINGQHKIKFNGSYDWVILFAALENKFHCFSTLHNGRACKDIKTPLERISRLRRELGNVDNPCRLYMRSLEDIAIYLTIINKKTYGYYITVYKTILDKFKEKVIERFIDKERVTACLSELKSYFNVLKIKAFTRIKNRIRSVIQKSESYKIAKENWYNEQLEKEKNNQQVSTESILKGTNCQEKSLEEYYFEFDKKIFVADFNNAFEQAKEKFLSAFNELMDSLISSCSNEGIMYNKILKSIELSRNEEFAYDAAFTSFFDFLKDGDFQKHLNQVVKCIHAIIQSLFKSNCSMSKKDIEKVVEKYMADGAVARIQKFYCSNNPIQTDSVVEHGTVDANDCRNELDSITYRLNSIVWNKDLNAIISHIEESPFDFIGKEQKTMLYDVCRGIYSLASKFPNAQSLFSSIVYDEDYEEYNFDLFIFEDYIDVIMGEIKEPYSNEFRRYVLWKKILDEYFGVIIYEEEIARDINDPHASEQYTNSFSWHLSRGKKEVHKLNNRQKLISALRALYIALYCELYDVEEKSSGLIGRNNKIIELNRLLENMGLVPLYVGYSDAYKKALLDWYVTEACTVLQEDITLIDEIEETYKKQKRLVTNNF